MSKLYNTLEKIRKNEAVPAAAGGAVLSASSSIDREGLVKTALLIGVGISLIILAYFIAPKIGALINKNTLPPIDASKIIKQAPATRSKTAKITPPDKLSERLNKQAVILIKNDQHWQAIRLLLKANTASPGAVEPLINLGVTFAELGLYGPANRYFSLAYGLEPGHIVLKKNLSILRAAGLLEKPLAFYFSSAAMGKDRD